MDFLVTLGAIASSQVLDPKARAIIAPILAIIGAIYVGSKLSSFLKLLVSVFISPGKSLNSFGPKGTWALITGASDGIGAEFATQLAQKGFNVVLVSRTMSKLDALAQKLSSTYNIKTHTLAMDFAANEDEDYANLATLIAPLDIGILINNVGKSHDIPVPFVETSATEMADIITINCMGTLRTTALVLPDMISRKNGLILTMGSFGGLLPTPLLATYSGSKAFLQQWSSALSSELSNSGITVELVQSYLVTSAMSKVRKPSAIVPTPKTFVRSVLSSIGNTGGAQGFTGTSTPYWCHAVMQWALGTTFGFSRPFAVHRIKIMHESMRKRALRKQEREAKKA